MFSEIVKLEYLVLASWYAVSSVLTLVYHARARSKATKSFSVHAFLLLAFSLLHVVDGLFQFSIFVS